MCRFGLYYAYGCGMGTPPNGTAGGDYADLRTAPDHLVDLLASNLPAPERWAGPPDASAAAVRQTARLLADRIWSEAAHRGAVWGMSRASARIVVSSDELDRLKDWPTEVKNL